MSQWPNWLRGQYGELEICGSNPGFDTNFFSQNYHLPKLQYHKNDKINMDLNLYISYTDLVYRRRPFPKGSLSSNMRN